MDGPSGVEELASGRRDDWNDALAARPRDDKRRIADPKRALRLARAVVSDILTYHPELVRDGLANDDLFERLSGELAEGRSYFEERVDEEIAHATNAWNRAVVDVLVYGSKHVRTRIW
jgi:hypothetical protein